MDYYEQKRLIELNIKNVKYIKKVDKRLHRYILNHSFHYIEYLKDVDTLLVEEFIRRCPQNIRYVENQTENMQLISLSDDIDNDDFLKNPTKKVIEYLIDNESWYNGYDINLLSLEYQLKAIAFDSKLIKDIVNLSDEMIQMAFKVNKNIVQYIKNPTDMTATSSYYEMYKEAVSSNYRLLKDIPSSIGDELYDELVLSGIKDDGRAIKFARNLTPEMMLLAVKKTPLSIEYIPNPTYELQHLAVSLWNLSLYKIKNPHPDIQWTLALRDSDLIIENPCENVKLYKKFLETGKYEPEMFDILVEVIPNSPYLIAESTCIPGSLQLLVKTGISLNFGDSDINITYHS